MENLRMGRIERSPHTCTHTGTHTLELGDRRKEEGKILRRWETGGGSIWGEGMLKAGAQGSM